MKSTSQKKMLTIFLILINFTPSLASGGMNIIDGIARVFLILALSAFVVLIIPIITVVVGLTKNNRSLKNFSKIYSLVVLVIAGLSLLYNRFELLEIHLIFIGLAALPLIILRFFDKQG